MSKVLYVIDNKKNYKYKIDEDTIIYHFSINNSSKVDIDLVTEGVTLYYYYNNINYDDNEFKIRVNHKASNTHSELYNHGVNVKDSNHSAYIGKFSEEKIFYLMSRGINREDGTRLLLESYLINSDSIDLNKIEEFIKEIDKI